MAFKVINWHIDQLFPFFLIFVFIFTMFTFKSSKIKLNKCVLYFNKLTNWFSLINLSLGVFLL